MRSDSLARRWMAPFMAVVTMMGLVLFLQSTSLLSSNQILAAPLQELTSQASCSSELFFSEYIEGSSSNKAIEIYNGTGTSITFTDNYTVGLFSNGNSTANNTVALSGMLADGDVYVIANSNSVQAILDQTDLTSGVANFNGDDALVLFKDGVMIDVIGQVGTDPGSQWGTGDASTQNNTIVRKDTVTIGDSNGGDAFDPATEWDGFANDTFSFLGSHSQNCGGAAEPDLTISKDAPATGMASERITYTIGVDNMGAASANDVMITDTLPTGVSYVSYQSSSPLTFTNNAPVLVWEAGTVTTDTEIVISLTVDLPASFTATITNTVQITTSTAGDSAANNSDTAVTSPAVDGSPDPNAPELLLSEILVSPTTGEFVEIHNPTTGTIDLTNVYLTDATFANGSVYYYNIVTGANAGGGGFGDFHARFPNGASIPAGAYQTIALNGSADFMTEYGMAPTYELYDDSSNDGELLMLEAFAGSINNQGGLSNGDEVVILYYWDGSSDLVTDLDYVVWGDKDEGFDKTGVALDGSDADSISTAYRDETAIASQEAIGDDAHDDDNSWQREDLTEGAEAMSGGNGVGGDDETSEDVSNTWCQEIPTPNVATLCGADIVSVQKNGPANAQAGERITYTIEVNSFGPIDASDVVITDTLPSDVTFVGYTSSFPITFTNNAPILVWATDSITTGTSLLIELSVDTSMTFEGSITNTVEITTSTPGDQTLNNQDMAVTQAVGSGGPDPDAPSLLLTEVKAQPTAGEFVEIYNPTTGTIDLSDVYLTDATFAGGGAFYYNIVTGLNAGGGGFGDFHARFPAGATIPAGTYQTIAVNGSANFVTEYGMAPTYELYGDGSSDGEAEMLEALPGSVNGQGGLSNDGEVVVLYHWDGMSDLVTDLDYTLWGDRNEAVDKTGIATDGPDADASSTAYLDDTATDIQDVLSGGAHATANSWQREDMTEGEETMSGGNGTGGDDETSEDLSNTWCEELASPGEISPCAGADLLSVEKNAPAEANPSDTITYTIDVANVGDISAENVLIIDTLPDDVTYVSYSSSTPLTFTNNAPNLEWEAGTMASNSDLTISLTVLIDADFSAPLVNTVVVSSSTAGDDPDNNSDEAVTTLPTGGACGAPFSAIYGIQGDGASSPLPDGTLITTEGVVVGDFQDADQLNGFFLQDATGDGNAATSDGIFVFAPDSADVAEGDLVRLTAEVSEFFDLTELSEVSDMLNCGTGSATPATLTLPVDDISDFEPYEGMLINIPHELYVTEIWQLKRYGQVTLSEGARLPQPTDVITPGLDANLLQAENDKHKIILDDGSSQQNPDPIIHPSPELSATNTIRGGDMVPSLTGILHYRASEYRVEPIDLVDFTHTNERPEMHQDIGGSLKVASFNVLNYFSTIDDSGSICGPAMNQGCRGADSAFEFTRQRDKIINAIVNMDADIVGLMEIENNSTAALEDLVDGLNAIAGAGTYDYIDTGTIGTDAIKVAMIYKPATVTAVGDFAILDSSVDAMFNDQKNRPALAQTFDEDATGERLTIVVNHFKSKGSACDDVGDPNMGDGQGNCNQTRTNAATAEVNWLATDPTGSDDPDFLIIGDINAYAMEDPISAIKDAGYTNLVQAFKGLDAYSYVFDGQWGSLDHSLANESLTPQVTGVTNWHINADEPNALDYNEEFKSADQLISLYNAEQYRASDHDPVIVGLNLYTLSEAEFTQEDYTVDEDAGTATISVILSAPVSVMTTVDYSTMDGTATAGEDYEATSGTLTFGAGTTSADFTVTILDDGELEADETVMLQLTSPMPSRLSGGGLMTATLTILDDELPDADFSQEDYIEDEDAGTAMITVMLSAPADETTTVEYSTMDGTATAGEDYDAASGTLTFPAGSTSASFNVTLLDDDELEADETVMLEITSPMLSLPNGGMMATLTILDNELPDADFSQDDYIEDEDAGTAMITVNLSAAVDETTTVDYSTMDGTATAGEDYDAASGTLTFAAGSTSATFNVTLIDDEDDEGDETVMLEITSPMLSLRGGDSMMATLTILDNDDDDDSDGISDEIEDGVPNPDGSGNGDGNGDGIPDNEQTNVSSLPNATEDETYVTLESPAGTSLIDVQASPAPTTLPEGVAAFPQGVFDFIVDGVAMDETVIVTLTLHTDDADVNSYWKQDANDQWNEFDYDGTTGAIIGSDSHNNTLITLYLMDGERGDNDDINGQITDPGAPALRNTTAISLSNFDNAADMSQQLAWLGLLLLMLMVGLWLYGKRKAYNQ